MVIDYKSDSLSCSELQSKQFYWVQLEIYRRAVEILGMSPAIAAIYGVHEEKLIFMELWDEGMLEDIIQQAGIQQRCSDRNT
jgi:hypothetical protein